MAWEWVGSVGTAVVGLGGIMATYWTGRAQREVQYEVANSQRWSSISLDIRREKTLVFSKFLGALERYVVINHPAISMPEDIRAAIRSVVAREFGEEVELSEDPRLSNVASYAESWVGGQLPMLKTKGIEAVSKLIENDYRNDVLNAEKSSVPSVTELLGMCSEVRFLASSKVADLAKETLLLSLKVGSPGGEKDTELANDAISRLRDAMKLELNEILESTTGNSD